MKVILEPFPHCNIKCEFCCQKEYKTSKSKLELVNNTITTLKSLPLKNAELSMWGGELFCWNDSKLLDKMKELLDVDANVLTITSNFLFDTTDLLTYIEYARSNGYSVNLSGSYDFWGRFTTKDQVNLFYNNVKDLDVTIEILTTSLALKILLNGTINKLGKYVIKIFEKLYETHRILFNLPTKYYTPSTYELVRFYKYVNEKYPKHAFLKWYSCKTNLPVECECFYEKDRYIIVNGELVQGTCVDEFGSKDFIVQKFKERFKCDQCEYNIYCHSICVQKFFINDWDECFMKEIFRGMKW